MNYFFGILLSLFIFTSSSFGTPLSCGVAVGSQASQNAINDMKAIVRVETTSNSVSTYTRPTTIQYFDAVVASISGSASMADLNLAKSIRAKWTLPMSANVPLKERRLTIC